MISPVIRSFFLPIFRKHRKIFFLLAADGIISGIVAVVLPVFAKWETDQLVGQKPLDVFGIHLSPFEVFVSILGIILLVDVIERLVRSISNIMLDSYRSYVQNDIQLTLFRQMERMEVGRTMNNRFRHIGQVLDREFDNLVQQILGLPAGILEKSIKFVGIVSIYTYFDIRILIVLILSGGIGYVIDIFAKRISAKYEIQWKFTLGRKQYLYSDLFLRNFIDLATNSAVGSMIRSYDALLQAQVKNGLQQNWANISWDISRLVNNSLSQIIIKAVVGYGVFIGTNSIGMVALVIASTGTVNELIMAIFNSRKEYRDFRFREASIELFFRICAPVGTLEKRTDAVADVSVKIDNLSFAYPNLAGYELEYFEIVQKRLQLGDAGHGWMRDMMKDLLTNTQEAMNVESKPILKNLSATFEKGKIYGIVGKNGSGKTTLMHLLAGFFRDYGGEIRIGGSDTRTWYPNLCAQHVSFLTQVPYTMNYNANVRENIMLGVDTSVDDERIWKYLETFGIADKIRKHAKGLDADLGDDIDFSGGERQIMAFIRILLQDRPIVILDEGTNQLDAENELLVMSELLKMKENKIIVFITHRMSTVSRADWIYCIEDGHVVATGDHRTLLDGESNPYARFYRAQILHS